MKSKTFFLASEYVNPYLELKLPSFFGMMQSIAAEDVEDKGINKSQTIDKGCTWIVSRVEVDIIETPCFPDTITLDTYPGEDFKILFPRYFRIRNQEGKELVRASSIWALLDLNKRVCVTAPFEQRLEAEHHEGELPLPQKIKTPEEATLVESRLVRCSDIDLNNHLNNVKYIDFIFDTHDASYYEKKKLKHFIINYNHEVKAGQTVDLYTNGGSPEIIFGKVDGVVAFIAELTFEERK